MCLCGTIALPLGQIATTLTEKGCSFIYGRTDETKLNDAGARSKLQNDEEKGYLFRYFLAQDRDDFLSSKGGVRDRHSYKYKSGISGFLKFLLHGGRFRGGEEFVVVLLL